MSEPSAYEQVEAIRAQVRGRDAEPVEVSVGTRHPGSYLLVDLHGDAWVIVDGAWQRAEVPIMGEAITVLADMVRGRASQAHK